MPDLHNNFAYSTVATAPSPASSGTSLVVSSGDGAKFPTPPFNATVWAAGAPPLSANAEIVRVTNVSTDTLTITRSAESTSARSVIVGDQIAAAITAGTFDDYPAVFNVKSPTYGAKGDNSTDDTTAINNALAAMTSGGTLWFPLGTYLYTGDLTPLSNVHIMGAGEGTILKAKTSGSNTANCFKLNNVSNVSITDLQINGNKANIDQSGAGATYTTKQGVYITGGSSNIVVERCYINNTFAGGVVADNASHLFISNNRLDSCGDNAIFTRPSPVGQNYVAPYNVVVFGNEVSGGTYSGIGIIKSSWVSVFSNISRNNAPLGGTSGQGSGIVVEGTTNCNVSGNVCHDNGVNGIDLRYSNEGDTTNVASAHLTVTGNECYNNGYGSGNGNAGGIITEGVDDMLIQGNNCYRNDNGINIGPGNNLDPQHVLVSGNICRQNRNVGLKFPAVNNTPAVDLVAEANEVSDNGSDQVTAACKVTIRGGYVARPTLMDDFNQAPLTNTAVNAGLWVTSNSADPTQVNVASNQLQITHGTGPQTNECTSKDTFNLTGINTYINVADVGNTSLASHFARFGVTKDSSNKVYMQVVGANLQAFQLVATVATQIGANITYSSTTHAWWRIRESGGTTFFDTASDVGGYPGAFTNRWSASNPITVTAITCFASTGDTSTEASGSHAYFDNFYLPITGKNLIRLLAGGASSVVDGVKMTDPLNNGLQIDSTSTGVVVRNCVFDKNLGSGGRGLFEGNNSGAGTVVENCKFIGFTFQSFAFSNANSLAKHCDVDQAGFYTQASGTASWSSGTTVAVTHNLWTTPTRVMITPTADPVGRVWVTTKGATTFTANNSNSGSTAFDWEAITWDN